MTREEAKQWLEAMKSVYALPIETYEAIDMAIEALQNDTIEFDFNKYRPSVRNKVYDKHDCVAVVRCKDCRYGWYDDDIEYYTCRHPKGLNEELYGVDYCSYGERREP